MDNVKQAVEDTQKAVNSGVHTVVKGIVKGAVAAQEAASGVYQVALGVVDDSKVGRHRHNIKCIAGAGHR